MVAILDDGALGDNDKRYFTKRLPLSASGVEFDGVDTGTKIKVQLAIVTTINGTDYLISDILQDSITANISAPSFSTDIFRSESGDVPTGGVVFGPNEGTFYYIGYNERFYNYKADGLKTSPETARLRIGLLHGSNTDKERKVVEFSNYVIRIANLDGRVVVGADDVNTVESEYSRGTHFWLGIDGTSADEISAPVMRYYNVRVRDVKEDVIFPHVYDPNWIGSLSPVDNCAAESVPLVPPSDKGFTSSCMAGGNAEVNGLYALVSDEHRDFPIDTLQSDETYVITAWAVDKDGAVISPQATLKVRPVDTAHPDVTSITDYIGANIGLTNVVTTEFTVIK